MIDRHSLAFRSRRALVLAALVSLGVLPATLNASSPFLRGSADSDADAEHPEAASPAVLALGPRTVTVAPGANAILELAIDHLNRIVTPFERPSVRTVSEISTEVEGNVVYVATASEAPATLYISAGDAARTTVALTLAPRRVPPREIRLSVPGYRAEHAAAPTKPAPTSVIAPTALSPARWQQSPPYLKALTSAFAALAREEPPEGLRARAARLGERPRCERSGLKVSGVKVYDGPEHRLITATLRYTGKDPLEIDHTSCRVGGKLQITAQATWPRTRLARGEETRLLLAVRVADPDAKARATAGEPG